MAVKAPLSIRARLIWGGTLVLLAFLAAAGWAVQKAYEDSVQAARLARLQTTVYLLMAGAELDAQGALVMPPALAEPRLSLPASGLYAQITNPDHNESWQSASAVGLTPPFQRVQAPGQWRFDTVAASPVAGGAPAKTGRAFLAATYAVTWTVNNRASPLVFSVLEDKAAFDRELGAFQRTLWLWLGGTGVLLLLTQIVLLRWGLSPLRQMAREVQRIEQGTQTQVEGRYPRELNGLTQNLNVLMAQERARQTRFKDALDDLAHSLKTPLAVMRASLDAPKELPALVAQQVARMDDIVVHQLGRAGASGAARFAPPLAMAPVIARIQASLDKVYADKHLSWVVDCPPDLTWRIDEGDAFEMLGNVLDNAAKWARREVTVHVWTQDQRLHLRLVDDGPGFADSQAVLQQRRVRLDEQVPGHGIGLAVVRDLVASHHGTLTVSRAPSGGAQLDLVLRVV
jgi:two-component system, OmpR family, sensor histidine kinase PhoQ